MLHRLDGWSGAESCKLMIAPTRDSCVSALERQRSWYVSTDCGCVAFLLHHSSSDPEPSAADMQVFICAGWWSTTHQFSTEQTEQDRKSDADTTLKHPVNFRIKHSVLTPDDVSLNFKSKLSLCAEPDLKWTDQRFSEAAVALDSVITTKSRSLVTPALRLCCALKHSLNAAGRC